MPELPEVETVCRSLRPHLVGRIIRRVHVLEPRLRIPVNRRALRALAGKRIDTISRIAKYILLNLSDDAVWLFHLGMSGKLICVGPETPRRKHDHIIVTLDSGAELRYHDPRRFGLSLVAKKSGLNELAQLRHVGLDPFDPKLTAEYLFRFTRVSERRIRDLLLDQQIIAGLGNIYANEILSLAAIKPTTRAYRLNRKQVGMIAATIPRLLSDAIRWCGTSFSDYRDADDRSGEFQNHLRVYDRHGEKCRGCAGIIKRIAIGNRSAYYCPGCQK
ncbi:MAG TPA: bifunctional DNA-formamidopyrimidine glycosylase/DNA-(apurinic or apyrimidinic site) lyase [Candidatus Binatia bacterium]|nr:bifunctional DNA-formamidopyrimidine glycosylase/DNA-(apurinic or apyrimidinic site) lyase [Candidatus Binatia bacterium]